MGTASVTQCGPFDLLEVIGEGGMARVWRGVHRAEQVPVAVKVITDANALEPEYQERFEREVQAVAALNHPSVVTVFDYGQIDEAAASPELGLVAGSPFLAMELAGAGTLRDRKVIYDWPALSAFLFDLFDALAHAHARDVIHRDIKPENILCQVHDGQMRFKLTDFGIAHAKDTDRTSNTGSYDGASAGTPQYMPPEQLVGDWRDFGPWTDLYAVGCVLYELACGHVPFDDDNFVLLANMHLNMPFPELEPHFEVPDELDAFIRRLVAKNPRHRFRRAADAAFALAQFSGEPQPVKIKTDAAPIDIDVTAETAAPHDVTEQLSEYADTVLDQPDFSAERRTSVLTHLFADTGEHDGIEGEYRTTIEFAALEFDPPPPISHSWRIGESDRKDDRLVGAGLGLFGLRPIPFVDRVQYRDAIWDALREVVEHGGMRGVSLHGPAGTGKSRLVEWMARRAHEVGATIVLRAAHSQEGGPAEGISRMLEDFFATWSLDRAETYDRVLGELESRLEDSEFERRDVEELARAITELAATTTEDSARNETGPRYLFGGPNERYRAVADVLHLLVGERPLFLWVDDAPWGADTLGLVDYLLREESGLDIVVVMTTRTSALEDVPSIVQRLDEIEADTRVRRMDVGKMSREDHVELIQKALRMDKELTEEVERCTEGNPLFAVQLIGEWVSGGILEIGPDGFSLRPGEANTLPGDIHQLWLKRVERLLDEFPEERRDDIRQSLELAAMFGQHVHEAEWREACRQRGIDAQEGLFGTMVEQGLARRVRVGASFAHGLLAESLRRAARRIGRAVEHRMACVRALEALYPDNPMKTAERRAHHLVAAGRATDALAPLKLAFHHAMDHGEYPRGARLLSEREDLADDLDLAEEDRVRVENLWMRAQSCMPVGNIDEALEYAERAAEIARRHGWRVDVGHALIVKSRVLRDRGEYERTLDVLDEAEEELEAAGDTIGLMFTTFGRGVIKLRQGRFEESRGHFLTSLEHARACEQHSLEPQILNFVGYAWFAENNYDEARDYFQQAREQGEQLGGGVAIALSTRHLGEIARYEQDWAEARRLYQRSLEIERTRGSKGRNQYLDELNLVLVDLGDERFEDAAHRADELPAVFEDHGLHFVVPIAHMARAAAAAGMGDRATCEEALAVARELLQENEGADKDLAWLTSRTAELCEARGWSHIAEETYELTIHLRNVLE